VANGFGTKVLLSLFGDGLVGIASKSLNKSTPALWFDRIRFMAKGQIYKCPNPDCFCEVTVFIQPANDKKPRCSCGAEMKKPYTKPALTELISGRMKLAGGI